MGFVSGRGNGDGCIVPRRRMQDGAGHRVGVGGANEAIENGGWG